MDDAGVREYAQSLAVEHCERAMAQLSSVEAAPESRRGIEEIAQLPAPEGALEAAPALC